MLTMLLKFEAIKLMKTFIWCSDEIVFNVASVYVAFSSLIGIGITICIVMCSAVNKSNCGGQFNDDDPVTLFWPVSMSTRQDGLYEPDDSTHNGAINGHALQTGDFSSTSVYINHVNNEVTNMTEPDVNYAYMDASQTEPLLGPDASEEDTETLHLISSESGPEDAVVTKQSVKTVFGEESSLRVAVQVFFPYLVAGFGMVGAGAVLEIVKVGVPVAISFHLGSPEAI
jgi:hypothetical protein